MSWDRSAYGSHAETSVPAPARQWYLAEGATHSGFQLFYLLQNPNPVEATVAISYLLPAPRPPVLRTYVVAPGSRHTIWVNTDAELAATDVSASIVADQAVVVERAMRASDVHQGRRCGLGGRHQRPWNGHTLIGSSGEPVGQRVPLTDPPSNRRSMYTLDALRHFAVARSLGTERPLPDALETQGFVQADPIRAPARAQDLTLRHRVPGYRAGDLERRYRALEIEEDVFINYGFVTRGVSRLMHPRTGVTPWTRSQRRKVDEIFAFVRASGEAHPRFVEQHLGHGTVRNYWGGSSKATTHLLDQMHYAGLLRVCRREGGIRIYAARDSHAPPADRTERSARLDALADAVIRIYAPMPASSLSTVVSRLRYAVPQWQGDLMSVLQRAKRRLAHSSVAGVTWYWPADERIDGAAEDAVRLLAPFDPIVWDRRRFALLWGWTYRFEAYTPQHKRERGYYALPLLWRDHVVGWANMAIRAGALVPDVGYVAGRPPRERGFKPALEAELGRFHDFLDLGRP
jgi:uncharacterized protein YcaQ